MTAYHDILASIVPEAFSSHPFSRIADRAELESVLPDYLAMSIAFRYLLSAAQRETIFEAIDSGNAPSEESELFNAVSNFLAWDETGGNDLLLAYGRAGLPLLIGRKRLSHSAILHSDIEKILGRSVATRFGRETQAYLHALHSGLASMDIVVKCAHLVGFEIHAHIMIEALRDAISRVVGIETNSLPYFELHVGDEDPLERYHVDMTEALIDRSIAVVDRERFLSELLRAFRLNLKWCEDLAGCATPVTVSSIQHHGSCHCGAVAFAVMAPAVLRAVRCNCTICRKSGFLHLMIDAEAFRLLHGEESLASYRFNRNIANHLFCEKCGVKSFYRPRSNPQGYSVNVNCLDPSKITAIEITDFDGLHWEDNIHKLKSASDEIAQVRAPA